MRNLRPLIAIVAVCLAPAGAGATAMALQVTEPWQLMGPNTGTVNGVTVTAVSGGDAWTAGFNNDVGTYSSSLFGSLRAPAGTVGDFFRVAYSQGDVDTVTITLGGDLVDPVLYISDIDIVGASVTFAPGGASMTNSADGVWNGNTLTATSGVNQGTSGAFGAIQYLGTFGAGSTFTFTADFTNAAVTGGDFVAYGIVVLVPEPGVVFLLAGALVSSLRRRRGADGALSRA